MSRSWNLLHGDCLAALDSLEDESAHMIWTSPPYYGLRDYGVAEQIGQESSPESYIATLVSVFRKAKRILKQDGTLWINIGDTYSRGGRKTVPPHRGFASSASDVSKYGFVSAAGNLQDHPVIKPKDLLGIPWRLALALQEDGWYLRQDIIWSKPNPLPESVKDRCTNTHEYVFLLSKSSTYHFDYEAIMEPASGGAFRRRRSVWEIATTTTKKIAHFATAPEELVSTCILAGCPEGGTVLDPFAGAGTTLLVADKMGRNSIGIELNVDYIEIAEKRLRASRQDRYAPWQEGYLEEDKLDAPESVAFDDLFTP